jgi:hypothetical protein
MEVQAMAQVKQGTPARDGRAPGGIDAHDRAESAAMPRDDEAALDAADAGTLSSGYSRQSSSGGSPGDARRQVGLPQSAAGVTGTAPQANDGAQPGHDALAHAGATAGAAGEDAARAKVESRDRAAGRVADHDEDESMDGAASVVGVSGVSGGTSGTTRIDNTRK